HERDEEDGRLICSSELHGVEVYSADGAYLGDIDAVVIDCATGWVAFAIISCGDWLGSGERLHPLPWSVLEYAADQRGYVVPIERATLEEAPAYSADEIADSTLPWREIVHHHYGAPPYWS
ncbi:MAG TPA: PRC-barrel domain-containing protein, partial [Steroidobacteraceae bacterium]|nr:PRC-barrel domain-containing protein [Steroidobacteraceae bacterium]